MRYYSQFPEAIPQRRARSHALLTRPPLTPKGALDLHVLSLPPAFNLSHDQTLQFNLAMKLFKEASKLGSSNLAKSLKIMFVMN